MAGARCPGTAPAPAEILALEHRVLPSDRQRDRPPVGAQARAWVYARDGLAAVARGSASDVEEHRLALALQADVEAVDRGAAVELAIEPLGDQRRAALLPLDQVEHRVLAVGLGLVAEVDPRVEADVDAARDDPGVDVGRHDAPVAPLDAARLDRVERVDAGLEVGAGAPPAPKRRVDR